MVSFHIVYQISTLDTLNILQFYVSIITSIKLKFIKNVLNNIACLLAELKFLIFHWPFIDTSLLLFDPFSKLKITCQHPFITYHSLVPCLNQMISKLVWKEILSSQLECCSIFCPPEVNASFGNTFYMVFLLIIQRAQSAV